MSEQINDSNDSDDDDDNEDEEEQDENNNVDDIFFLFNIDDYFHIKNPGAVQN